MLYYGAHMTNIHELPVNKLIQETRKKISDVFSRNHNIVTEVTLMVALKRMRNTESRENRLNGAQEVEALSVRGLQHNLRPVKK